MRVTIVSDTIQEFGGERFYLCGKYFQHKGKRLHVAVWRHHKGAIPNGCHVHHVDGNRANNQIENLELLESFMHLSQHASEREEYNQRHIKDMRELASEWHGSDAGRAWHSEHAKESWENKRYNKYTCSECGKEFETRHDYGAGQNTFCSNACKSKNRAKSGVDDEERICAYCGKPFTVRRRWGK